MADVPSDKWNSKQVKEVNVHNDFFKVKHVKSYLVGRPKLYAEVEDSKQTPGLATVSRI